MYRAALGGEVLAIAGLSGPARPHPAFIEMRCNCMTEAQRQAYNAYHRKYYAEHGDKIRARNEAIRRAKGVRPKPEKMTPEEKLKRQRENYQRFRQENPEKMKMYCRKHYEKHKDIIKAKWHEYYETHKEQEAARKARWYQEKKAKRNKLIEEGA